MSEHQPLFSLAYTTVRPHLVRKVVRLWNRNSRFHDIEWVICVDKGDDAALAEAIALKAEVGGDSCRSVKVTVNDGPKTCVAGWNKAAAESTGKVIICVADDFAPPEHWDDKLVSLHPRGWVDGEHVVHVDDGYVHNIFVLSILTRKRYERYGYVFYPKYQSMFCDTEMTEVAQRDGVVIEAPQLLFEHLHPDCGKRDRDEHDLNHASSTRWNTGEQLFNLRKTVNFPVDDGPKAGQVVEAVASKSSVDYIVYMQLTKDDLCLYEVCKRMMEEGVSIFYWAHPSIYWSGETIDPQHRVDLDAIAERLRSEGAVVRQKDFNVKSYTFAGDSRIVVETRVRNDSLAWIRGEGYRRILIVDGDELWLRGTLGILKPYVDQGHLAISTQMVPVAGCPGCPIDRATDLAVVYVGGSVNFSACRTPTVRQSILPVPRIIHFTSTRKDMAETIEKHRRSGHYDDPEYDFEGWIKDKLPKIKPGEENIHMFTRYQIWPRAREWRPEEIAEIPKSIWPYLHLPGQRGV